MNRIRELRISKGWRQIDLADKMNTAKSVISRYETEQLGIDAETICQLCDIFGCTSDYLLCRSAAPSPVLTPEEESLLMAWRRCDDRARDMVVVALAPFASDESQSATG